jgi:hypothetical protein
VIVSPLETLTEPASRFLNRNERATRGPSRQSERCTILLNGIWIA